MDCPRTRRVYLPAGEDWYDFYTNRRFTGGQWVEADAELSKIPLFVKAGSVIPMQKMEEIQKGERYSKTKEAEKGEG